MTDTIFSKIVNRELPAQIVYEDEHTLAFLDIAPNTKGHTLVIPKKACENVFDCDPETLSYVMETVRRIAPAVRDAVGAAGVHINSNHGPEAGQEVPYLHFHIIPRHAREEFTFCWDKVVYDPSEIEDVATRIRTNLA